MWKSAMRRVLVRVGLPAVLAVASLTAGATATLQWTQENPVSGTGTTADIFQVIYAGGRYVAVTAGGTSQDAEIMESADGVTWNTVYQDKTGLVGLSTVAYGNGIYVAMGGYTANGFLFPNGYALVSPDGINWTVTTTKAASGGGMGAPVSDVVYGNGEFAVFTSSCDPLSGNCYPSAVISTSSDGVQWDFREPVGSGAFSSAGGNLGFADGKFVTLVTTGITLVDSITNVYLSTDAAQWTQSASFASPATFSRIRALGNGFMAVGSDYSQPDNIKPAVAMSPDGVSWTATELDSGDLLHQVFTDVAQVGNTFLATSTVYNGSDESLAAGLGLVMSTDGLNWCEVQSYPLVGQGDSVAVNGGQIVTAGFGGRIYSTPPSTDTDVPLSCGDAMSTGPVVKSQGSGDITVSSGSGSGGGGFGALSLLALALGFLGRRRQPPQQLG